MMQSTHGPCVCAGLMVGSFVVVAGASPTTPIDAERGYTFVDIGTLAGSRARPEAINDLGDIAGNDVASDLFETRYNAWIWRNGGFVDLTAPMGVTSHRVYDLNNYGFGPGQSQTGSFPLREFDGIYWEPNGDFNFMFSDDTNPFAASNSPLTTFAGQSDESGIAQPAVFLLGLASNISLPAGATNGAALDLNRLAEMVGYVQSSGGDFQPVFWPTPTSVEFAPVPGIAGTASGINDNRDIVGTYQTSEGFSRGYFWRPGVGFRTLANPDPVNARSWFADSVENSGVVVGSATLSAVVGGFATTVPRGVVWDNATGYVLNDLAPRRETRVITDAVDINTGGEIAAVYRVSDSPPFGTARPDRVALLYPRNGRVSFEDPVAYTTAFDGGSLATGDFNDDGYPDIAVACGDGGDVIQIFLNDFGEVLLLEGEVQGTDLYQIDAMDIDGDGDVDLVVSGLGGVRASRNNGSGAFGPLFTVYDVPGGIFFGIEPLDANGDGAMDLALARFFNDQVTVLVNNGAGFFTPMTTVATGSRPRYVATGDLNGDGRDDVVTGNQLDGVSVLFSTASGYRSSVDTYDAGLDRGPVRIGDLNHDGDLDIAYVDDDVLGVLINEGDGDFFAPRHYSDFYYGLSVGGLDLADMDMDGDLDFVVAQGSGPQLFVHLNRGSGVPVETTFRSASPGGGYSSNEVVTADLNLDGRLDVIVGNRLGNRLSVLLSEATAPADTPIGCHGSDLGFPYDTLDIADVVAFLQLFEAGNPDADIAPPFGTLDVADVVAFLQLFGTGCP